MIVLAGLDGSLEWFWDCLPLVPPQHGSHKFRRIFFSNLAYVAIIGIDYVYQLLLTLHLSGGPFTVGHLISIP